MAKSLHTTMDEGTLDIVHQGEEVTVNIPDWILELRGHLFDKDHILAWLEEYDLVVPVTHYFIKELWIALRAKGRPVVKFFKDPDAYEKEKAELRHTGLYNFNDKDMSISLSLIKDKENAQKRINEFVLEPIEIPGQAVSDKVSKAVQAERDKMANAMRMAGLPEEQIQAMLAQLK